MQEEIRFLICPELIVSRLFVAELLITEAIIITGVERFSSYEGYADTFTWKSAYTDKIPRDHFLRKETQVIAIDALNYKKPWYSLHQYFSFTEFHLIPPPLFFSGISITRRC